MKRLFIATKNILFLSILPIIVILAGLLTLPICLYVLFKGGNLWAVLSGKIDCTLT